MQGSPHRTVLGTVVDAAFIDVAFDGDGDRREQIAADLASAIVHQVFAASLTLHGALSQIEGHNPVGAADKIRDAIESLDSAVRDLRAAALDAARSRR